MTGRVTAIATRKMVLAALLITLGAALHAMETLLPNPLPLPGAKLGLANIVTLVALFIFGMKEAATIAVLRVLFASLLTGTFFSVGFFLSLSGALLSLFLMGLMLRFFPGFSIIGVSIAGAVAHNLGQLFLAAALIRTPYIFYYLPFLLAAGIPTGFLTGTAARSLNNYLEGVFPHGAR